MSFEGEKIVKKEKKSFSFTKWSEGGGWQTRKEMQMKEMMQRNLSERRGQMRRGSKRKNGGRGKIVIET